MDPNVIGLGEGGWYTIGETKYLLNSARWMVFRSGAMLEIGMGSEEAIT